MTTCDACNGQGFLAGAHTEKVNPCPSCVGCTFDHFLVRVTTRTYRTRERYGQAFYNELNEIRPDLARYIADSELDPFHWGEGDAQKMNDCCEQLQSMWSMEL